MIRIIDMREATSRDKSFSVWCTVTDRFIVVDDQQEWDGSEELQESFELSDAELFPEGFKVRILGLLPGWAIGRGDEDDATPAKSTNPSHHQCPDCGYVWEHGDNGSHDCLREFKKKLGER